MTETNGVADAGTPGQSVDDYLASLDDVRTVEDARTLMGLMHRISGRDPELWNVGTIGYDTYHYKYDSGREGDGHGMGFYPRKGKLTIYLLDGTARHAAQLERLGKHTTSRVCVYVKRLSDIQLAVLEEILRDSYGYLKTHDGQMHRAP